MRDLIVALLALAAIAGAGGGEKLEEAFRFLRTETVRKLSEPQPSLESFTRKMTGNLAPRL